MSNADSRFCLNACFDYGHGHAVITRVFDTSPLGVELRPEGSGVLNVADCRRLAQFLTDFADSVESPIAAESVLVSVPRALARDVVQGLAERIWYHIDGLKDDPLNAECLADANALVAFVKGLQKLFPEVEVEF